MSVEGRRAESQTRRGRCRCSKTARVKRGVARPQERRVGQARWPRPTHRKGESSGERPAAALRGLHRDGAAGWRAGQYIPVMTDEGGEKGRAEDGRDGRRVVEGLQVFGASFLLLRLGPKRPSAESSRPFLTIDQRAGTGRRRRPSFARIASGAETASQTRVPTHTLAACRSRCKPSNFAGPP
jgi:hypothetical protein